MTSEYIVLLAILHAAIALATATANLFLNHRRTVGATRNDAAKLRLAIAAELANLQRLCKDNIDALYAGKDVLVSARAFSAVYRGNVARVHFLSQAQIPAVVTAFAALEQADAFAAAYGKPHGQVAFSLGKERAHAGALIAGYEKAAASCERALRAFGEGEAAVAEAEHAGAEVRKLAAA